MIDAIVSWQREIKDDSFQNWTLCINEDKTALLVCDNGNGKELAKQEIEYSDLPLNKYPIWLEDITLLLSQEH